MAFLGAFQEQEQPSFGTQLARGLGSGLGSGLSQAVQFAQQMALQKQRSSSLANETKQLEKIKTLETGLGTIEKMRELLPFAGGFTSSPMNQIQSLFPGETQKKRSELESLGRSLIPLVAAGVPIRNKSEFEEYSKTITDPSASQSKLEGALNGIQDLLERSIGGNQEKQGKESKEEKPVFDVSNPKHKKTRDALMQKYKNDREKVSMELMKHFREE